MTNNSNIDDLLVKMILGEATADELRQAHEWIAENPDNEAYFKDFQLIWEESRRLAVQSTVNEDDAWISFQQRIASPSAAAISPVSNTTPARNADPASPTPGIANSIPGIASPTPGIASSSQGIIRPTPGIIRSARTLRLTSLRVAAAVLLFAVGAWLLVNYIHPSNQLLAINSGSQVLSDTLPEGSIIILNKQSSIRYDRTFHNGIRQIDMQGEAFFAVAPDKTKPFVVHTSDVSITVLGTSFNVSTINNITEIIVESGRIGITKNGHTLQLNAGEKALIRPGDSAPVKEDNADQLYKYYRTNTFECNGTPLWRLVDKLNEAYPTHITIGDDQIRNLPLSVTFDNESLEDILAIVAKTLSIKVIHNGQQITLKKA